MLAMGAMAGVALFATSNLLANEVPKTVNFALTARTQAANAASGDVLKFKYDSTRVTTKDILKLFGVTEKGAKIVLVPDVPVVTEGVTNYVDQIQAQKKDGTVITNLTDRFDDGWGNDVYKGQVNTNSANQSWKESGVGISKVTFNDGAGNSFKIRGLETFKSSGSKVKNGKQTVSESSSLNGAGDGSIAGDPVKPAVVSGKITAKGKGSVDVPATP